VQGTDASQAAAFWGDLKPVVSVKELMKYMIDPVADNIFNAVGTTITRQGIVEIEPKTEEDWDKIRTGAISLAEGAQLLKIRRPFTPPGDENNSTGPDATELSPAQIQAKLDADPVLWNAKIEALRNVGLEVMEIVRTKKVDELWDASDNLDAACESCHVQFWYPREGKILKDLDNKLENLFGRGAPRADRSRGR
jgi:cytochrome c556